MKNRIMIKAATIVPELKGRPTEFKKHFKVSKQFRVDGSNNLKMNSKIATEITLATINCLTVILL